MVNKQKMTLKEFQAFEKQDNKDYELLNEIMWEAPAPSKEHQLLLHIVHGYIYQSLKEYKYSAAGRFDFFWNGDVLKPDLMVFCNRDDKIPEIVFEILSPSTRHRDLGIKLVKYEQMGVKEYWIIDPKTKSITVHDFINQHAETYIIGETARSFIRPELEFVVTSIFEE